MDAHSAMMLAGSYGLAAFVYSIFWLYLINGARDGRRSAVIFMAVGLCALWAWAYVGFALSSHPFFLWLAQPLDVLRVAAWSYFLLTLLKTEQLGRATLPRLLKPLAFLLVGFTLLGLILQGLILVGAKLAIEPQGLVTLNSLGLTVLTLLLIEQLFRNVAPDARWSIKPLCVGLAGACLFDLYLYSDALLFKRFDVDAFSIRGFVHALAAPLVAMSTIRSKDWKTHLVLSQRAALQSATLVGVGFYLLFVAGAGYYVRYFGGEWGRALQIGLLFLALLVLCVLALSESLRAKLRVLIGKHFFSYRYDYREEWLRFTQTLSMQGDASELRRQVVHGLADLVESPAGSLWLRAGSGQQYVQAACWNMPVQGGAEPADSEFCRFLQSSGWVINLEEFRSLPGRYDKLSLPDWLLASPNAWLVVPVGTQTELIGFVVLATARTRLDVNWEVNDLLKTAGRQAGAFLGQMQATEALLEARKFDAFNRMSAFVVHDLKNIVTQLALMVKNAERHRDNPEFQQDMLMTVEHAVERMRQLMMQLREGATPVDAPRGVELNEVIRRIQAAKLTQGHQLNVSLSERLQVRVHEDRIERVIGHLVQNALDASSEASPVGITLVREGQWARLEVVDRGQGMSAEFIRERLFKPFQTTKPAGMGIGAYESFQYVQEVGGKVDVVSALGEGTTVTLRLPLFEPSKLPELVLQSEAK